MDFPWEILVMIAVALFTIVGRVLRTLNKGGSVSDLDVPSESPDAAPGSSGPQGKAPQRPSPAPSAATAQRTAAQRQGVFAQEQQGAQVPPQPTEAAPGTSSEQDQAAAQEQAVEMQQGALGEGIPTGAARGRTGGEGKGLLGSGPTAASQQPTAPRHRRHHLLARLRDRRYLRDAILAREVLDRPAWLRDDGE